MSKLRAKIIPFFCILAALSLVACGGQAVKPENTDATEVTAATMPENKSIVAEKAEPSPGPLVEVMPQKKVEEAQIAMEPIPAKEAVPAPEVAVVDAAPKAAVEAEVTVSPTASHESAIVAAAPAKEEEKKPAPTVPVSSGPNHFVVTVGAKQPSHPAYGKGHSLGFLVDGVSGKELVVERGELYTFDILTDPKHDVYLSKKAIGWGATPFSKGVKGAYTYKGKMTLKADKDTPELLYYACRNHPYMGGVIHVVDPGQVVDIKQQAAATKAAGGSVAAKAATVSAAKVKQKLMFAEMMTGSQGTKRVLASQNDEAKQLVAEAKKVLAEGHKKSMGGALPEALALANRALKMLSEAARLVPGDEELAALAQNYKSMLAEIKDYQKSYRSNIKRLQKKGEPIDGLQVDEQAFAARLAKAKTYADQKNYVHANKLLQEAQAEMTGALHKMLDSKTIVYDLNFETAADEYDYELKRFAGYEELIPVAIEAKKPAAGAIKLMESFLDKARKRRDEAKSKAAAGDYPTAIAMLLQATKTVRRALRMVGVNQ